MKSFTLVISQKKNLIKIFQKTNIIVLKKEGLLKNLGHLKDNKNYVTDLCVKIILYVYQNAR
jgi:hypothetical protein